MLSALRIGLLIWVWVLLLVHLSVRQQGDADTTKEVERLIEESMVCREKEVAIIERGVSEVRAALDGISELAMPTQGESPAAAQKRIRQLLVDAASKYATAVGGGDGPSATPNNEGVSSTIEGGGAYKYLPAKVGPTDDMTSFLLKLLHSVGPSIASDFGATIKGLILEEDMDLLEKSKGTLSESDYDTRRLAIDRRAIKYEKHPVLRALIVVYFRLYEALQYKKRIGEIRTFLQPYVAAVERRPDRMLYNYI